MPSINEPLGRKLRMALVGGGGSGFIGRVHHTAATLDQRAVLTASALSSDPARSRAAAADFGVEASRGYGSWQELLEAEAALPADQRVDFVAIATPNDTHFEIASAAVQQRFHVICDKPLTIDLAQAFALAEAVERAGVTFAVTHAYAGYPMVQQLGRMVRGGAIGDVLAVRVEYLQGGVWRDVPGQRPERAAWKRDPARSGPTGTLGDIGTHAFHLLRFALGCRPGSLCCILGNFHPARPLDDYGHVVLRFPGGAIGTLTVSQVSHGRLNDLRLEVDGTTGSLSWSQQSHSQLAVRRHGEPLQVFESGRRSAELEESVRVACRLPAGHPEGLLEAFANVYAAAFDELVARAVGSFSPPPPGAVCSAEAVRERRSTNAAAGVIDFPTVWDGVEGVLFVERCLSSADSGSKWVDFGDERW